jgi:hypothetical protein
MDSIANRHFEAHWADWFDGLTLMQERATAIPLLSGTSRTKQR